MNMYSDEHKKYIKKIKKNNFLIKITQILILIVFLIVWQILSDLEIINPFIFSSPTRIIKCLISLYSNNNLFKHILVTTYETLISFTLGTLLGIIIASILWWNKFLAKVVDPYLTIINSLPKVSLGPIIIIWFGANIKSIIVMALLISVIITIITIYNAFISTDEDKIKLLKTFKASKKQIFFKLILPINFNTIISTLKINISMTLIGVIMGELLVSKKGIGYLIMYGSQVFNLDLVILGIILLCIISCILYYSILLIEKKLLKK